jgi:D-alanyl-D-alanine carboxypeptidase
MALAASVVVCAAAVNTSGRADERYAAMVFDPLSRQVLFAVAADQLRFPASLTKMMTLYLLFQELRANRLSMDSPLTVSTHAAAQVPTKLGLKPGEAIKVEDAIKALVTHSANDVAFAIAENLEGDEPAFAARMTRVARGLGMNSTYFQNATGLPDPHQLTTARDMIVLGTALQGHFPEYFRYFRTKTFEFRGRRFRNHNRLIGKVEGVDGIKTGYVRASGFNVVTSARRDGRSLVAVVMGGQTAKARDAHMSALLTLHFPGATTSAAQAQRQPMSAAVGSAMSPK